MGATRDYLWLGAILLLALALRLWGLNAPLWYDEILTVETHLRLPWGQMMQGYSMNHHYFFDLQSKLAVAAFGETIWAIRLPALVFGLGAIAAIWWLARDIAGAAVAHLTGLLLAISYHHIWFSQNARGYTELAFWSALGMILFLRGMKTPARGLWLGYAVVLAAAVFTHLTGAFLFAAQGLVWLAVVLRDAARGRLARPKLLLPLLGYGLGAALTIALYAPLLPSLLQTVGGVAGTSAVDVMQEYQNPLWTIYEAVRSAVGSAGPVVGLVALGVIGLAVVGGVQTHRSAPLFAPLVLLHIVLTMALLSALGMRIWPRFFFADIGFLMLLIVLGVRAVCTGLGAFSGPRLSAQRLFTIAAALMIVVSAGLAARNYSAPKQNLAGAFDLVEASRKPGEQVYVVGVVGPAFTGHFDADWVPLTSNADYAAAMAQPGPALVVIAFPARTFRAFPDLDADSEGALTLLRRFPGTLGDGAVLVFRRG